MENYQRFHWLHTKYVQHEGTFDTFYSELNRHNNIGYKSSLYAQ